MNDELIKQLIAAQLTGAFCSAKLLDAQNPDRLDGETIAKNIRELWIKMKVVVDQRLPQDD